MESNPKWQIRAYQPGDERELVTLFQRVFGISISQAHWRWKLKSEALPVALENVWLAVDGEKIVFQYAGIPTRFRLPDGEQVAMVSVDTMASPDYRRQGFLTSVGHYTYEAWREAGVPFVIGLPNEQWGRRTVALGWEPLFPLQWLSRPLRPEAIIAHRLRLPFLERFSIVGKLWRHYRHVPTDDTVQLRLVTEAGAAFDVLWKHIATNGLLSVVRDASWVNWRYLTAPHYTYNVLLAERDGQPVGYIVYRLAEDNGRKVGFIAELTIRASDAGARDTLINRVLNDLLEAGAETAVTLAVPHTPFHAAWKQVGFLPRHASFSVQLVPLSPDLPMEIVRQPQNWHVTGGDFDII